MVTALACGCIVEDALVHHPIARAVFCSGNSQFARARLVKFYFLLNKKIKKELKDKIF